MGFSFSFQRAQHYHVNGGLILMVMSLLALIVANSPFGAAYHDFWQQEIRLQIGDFNFFNHGGHPLTVMAFINDALMSVFFFTVGLEIKREILVGELSSMRKAMLPIVAACGGMLFPVLIYFFLVRGTPAEVGMAIPMATDIAFSLGVLSLFSNRVPLSLKIFLTTFAVVDDIGGILIIALFYSSELYVSHLLYALGIVVLLMIGNKKRVYNKWYYIILGIVMWYLFMQSGIHATIAGVIVAFTVPAVPDYDVGKYINCIHDNIRCFPEDSSGTIVLTRSQIYILRRIEVASDHVISPLQSLEDHLHGFVNYLVIPLFAFANAGVTLAGEGGSVKLGMVSLAIMAGLVVGKFVGIYLFTWLVVRLGGAELSRGMNWRNLTGVCLLGGIGFTVSLFIANLSFGDNPDYLNQAKIGVLGGTILAGILSYLVLHITLPKKQI